MIARDDASTQSIIIESILLLAGQLLLHVVALFNPKCSYFVLEVLIEKQQALREQQQGRSNKATVVKKGKGRSQNVCGVMIWMMV